MRRWAFIIAILGMFVLLVLMNFSGKEIGSYSELEELEINQKVYLSGKVVSERAAGEKIILTLDKNITLICDCDWSFKDKEISVVGIVGEYENRKQVQVLRIREG